MEGSSTRLLRCYDTIGQHRPGRDTLNDMRRPTHHPIMRRARTLSTILLMLVMVTALGMAQARLPAAKTLRCSFSARATAVWAPTGSTDVTTGETTLVLLFEDINPDEGTATLRSGRASSEIVFRLAGDYLHFMQSFRTGPLYTTTVFNQEQRPGVFKAVHSRHELFAVPLPGATSSPEQYYGQCTTTN